MAEKQPEVKAPAQPAQPATKGYRLREGVGKHYVDGQAVQAGDVVQLTEAQYAAFRDKFEAE